MRTTISRRAHQVGLVLAGLTAVALLYPIYLDWMHLRMNGADFSEQVVVVIVAILMLFIYCAIPYGLARLVGWLIGRSA